MFLKLRDRSILLSLMCFSVAAKGAVSLDGELGFMSNQVNRDVGDVPGNRLFGDFNFDFKHTGPTADNRFTFASRQNDIGLFMFTVQEAYVGGKNVFKDPQSLSVPGDNLKFGRQVLDWAPIDAHWGLGKLNNRRNFDFFEPGQEGLVGLGYEARGEHFEMKFFGSGIYIPESNPALDINKKRKTVSSRHPWADPPASTAQVEGNETPVQYIVDYPKVNEVIWRYTIGGSLGWKNKHWSFDSYFMRKPENNLSTQVEVALAANSEYVKAFVNPQVYYHDVYGGNVKWKNNDVEIHASAIGIRPNTFPDGSNTATDYTEIKTKKLREAYGGLGITRINNEYGLGLDYIARLSPYDRDKDSLVQDPRWNQAVNVFLMKRITQSLKLSADVKYDMLTTDRLVMLRAGYNVSKMLLITLGVNMIGTPNDGKSYWSPFTNNDAVLVGARLIF